MKRITILMYGVVSYLAFFAVFTYLMGFLSGVLVPKDINGGVTDQSMMAVLINISMILLFAVQHTIMARPAFKKKWTKIIPVEAERSTFVLVTSYILALLFWQWRPNPAVIWSVESSFLAGILYGGCALGFGIVFYSSFLINHFDLFGLRQVFLQMMGKEYTHPELKVVSLYRIVRHPLMLGMLIAFWSTPLMTVGHFVFAAGFTAYILVGTRIEESTLIQELGDEYLKYQETTPALIPSLSPIAAVNGKSQPTAV